MVGISFQPGDDGMPFGGEDEVAAGGFGRNLIHALARIGKARHGFEPNGARIRKPRKNIENRFAHTEAL
jgi:hypothetical protein